MYIVRMTENFRYFLVVTKLLSMGVVNRPHQRSFQMGDEKNYFELSTILRIRFMKWTADFNGEFKITTNGYSLPFECSM